MILDDLRPNPERKDKTRIYPRYNGQSLVNVPNMVMDLLGVKAIGTPINKSYYEGKIDLNGINKVVLILLDGLGYKMWLDSNSNQGFFNKVSQKGLLIPITSTFPSTTAVAITTISTGLEPAQHGLPEWVVYLKEIKMIINTLPFTVYLSKKRIELLEMGYDSKILFKGKTLYEKLKNSGVKSFAIIHKNLLGSAYTTLTKRGSQTVGYTNPTDAVIKLRNAIETEKKAYIHLYIDNIDASTHNYGPYSEESRAEIESLSHILTEQLLKKVDKKSAEETLIIITSDHGHTRIDPKKVIYLNNDNKLFKYFATDDGKKILPTGSLRNVFVHIDPKYLKDAYEHLSKKLEGKAKVIYSKDAIAIGLFGTKKPGRRLMDRIGDIIILPNVGEAVWYEHIEGFKHKYTGVHGGLSEDEMLIPLGMARLSDLL